MRKLSDWIKKNIFNEKQSENTERNEDNAVDEKKREESISEIKEEKTKEKIYISHMDDLFWEAGRLIIEKNRGSVGLLQREFKIGFNRAARIMDELCEAGVVGEEIGTAPRKILISYDELDELLIESRIEVGEKIDFEIDKKAILKEYIYPPVILLRKKIDLNGSFGFELPFRSIIESREFKESKHPIPFAIGRDIEGKYVVGNILEFPDITISDNTYFGKLACLNSIIMSILYKESPENTKIILIDTEERLSIYNGIPHLLIPVVTNVEKSFYALHWAIVEMVDRIHKFKDYGVENINEYNISSNIECKMPLVVIFINEFSDLIFYNQEEIGEMVDRLSKSAIVTGIYTIIIETNFNCSISVGRNIEHKKKIVVVPSADLMRNRTEPTFVQGSYVSDNEILAVVDFLRVQFENQTRKTVETKGQHFEKSNRIDMYNNKIDYMTGEDFELYVAQMLGKIGFYNIQTTKGSGDQGVDILAEKEGMKYAFQCKRYDKPVGNKAVQEVFAGKFFYHCHVAIVVTNNYFTQSAKDLAHENGVVLWDRNYLEKFL